MPICDQPICDRPAGKPVPACDRFAVVVVPFPFVDAPRVKRRPALALTTAAFAARHEHGVFAMITSARHSVWPSDVALQDWQAAGLTAPSILRFKLFTLPTALIEARLGQLGERDGTTMEARLRSLFALQGSGFALPDPGPA